MPRSAADGLPRRRQRLRDLGAGVEVQTAGGDVSKLVASFPGLFVQSIDGTDFIASHRAMAEAVTYARSGKGPALVHARVIRPYSHSLSDDEKLYKTKEERAAESLRDPITRLGELLTSSELASEEELAAIRRDVEREVNNAAEAAIQSEKPSPDTAALFVYSPDVDPTSAAFAHRAFGRRQAGHDGRRDQPHLERRDDAQSAHRHLRRGRRGLPPRRPPAKCPARAASSRSPMASSARSATTRVFNSPLAEACIIGRAMGWRPAASSRWSRSSSSTTSGRP